MPLSSLSVLQQLTKKLSSGFILAFHEIPAERFISLIEGLGPLEIVPLETLVQRSKTGKSTAGLFAVTVDDCVGENTRSLVKALEAKTWPATFYAPTSYLDTGEGMPFQWWFKLKPFLPGKILHLKSQDLDFSAPDAVEKFFKKMELLWHTKPRETYVPTIMEMVEVLIRDHQVSRASLIPPAPLSWSEVSAFSRNDLIRFESHGVSHTAMSALSESDLEAELQHSKRVIAEHTGRECRHLAYPFGSPQSIGDLCPRIAARHYDSATTMSLGCVDHANSWLIPRIPLYPKNTNQAAHMKILLTCSRLARLRFRSHRKSSDLGAY